MKKYLVAGLLVWLPLAVTIGLLGWLLGAFDSVFSALLSATAAVLPLSAASVIERLRRQGSWTIAFITGRPGGEVALRLPGDYVSVYVPTTPNPTSGFFLMMPRGDVLPLAMSVDEALKFVISMGVVGPPERLATATAGPAAALPGRN